MIPPVIIKKLTLCEYLPIWQQMRLFTDQRDSNTPDEIWLLQHYPVFTQGQAGKAEHLLNPGEIPVVQTDRGGQVTYHGPGQLIAYTLFDIDRLKLGSRDLVRKLERTVIDLLAAYGLTANNRCDAPGVYIDGAKICSIGLRVRKGCCYHGIALNVAMDLTPFSRINPCGHQGMKMIQLSELINPVDFNEVQAKFTRCLQLNFGYNEIK